MIQNPITFVLDASGNYLGQQRGTIRALSNYASKIYVVAPFESVALKVNYLVYGTQREIIGQYLAPTALYGRDVLASNDPNLSTASNWQVWEVSISQRALHRIAKYRAGRIGVSFQVLSIAQPSQALNFVEDGTLTSANGLPNPATYEGDDGDYYVSDVWNYTDQYIAGTFAKGTYFYFDDDAWVEGQNITYIIQTTTVDLAVDPSLLAELPADISEDAEIANLIDDLIGDVATLQATLDSHITDYTDPHDLQANQVESTDGDVQTDIDNLQGDIADIVDGTTPLDYTVTDEEYIIVAEYIRDAIKELDGKTYAADQQLAQDISLKVSKALSNTLTELAIDDKIYVYDTSVSDAKFITVEDFVTQVVVDLASFGIVILAEGEYDEQNDIPTVSNPLPNKLYLYDNPESAPNNYDEWLWTGTAWEKLGVFSVDLDDYYDKDEADGLLDGKSDVGHTHPISDVVNLQDALDGKEPANANIQSHISSTSNPHSVTKTQVGLGNVDNTSDLDKPISTTTQTALNGKVSKTGDTMTGDLTIQKSAPAILLNSTNGDDYYIANDTGTFRIGNTQAQEDGITILDNGDVGINKQSPTEKLDVDGNIKASGSVTGDDVIATSTVKVGNWVLSENGTSGSLDFSVS